MKAAIFTLGCKVNQYESQVLINEFAKNGFEITDFDKFSDVYIINTCSVTGISDKKSRQMIKRAIKLNPDALICVTGCYSQVSKEEVEKIEGVDIITGTKDRLSLVSMVKENMAKKQK
jgi:threonylcarbamoyladenosine tRNA methylthiotransferase MtaB